MADRPKAEDRPALRRVVITGFGVISGIGTGSDFLTALREGKCGTRPIMTWDTTGLEHALACEVTEFDPATVLRRIGYGPYGRVATLAAAATRMAIDDAALSTSQVRAEHCVLAVGTTSGEALDVDALTAAEVAEGLSALPRTISNRMGAGRLSAAPAVELGLTDVEAVTIPAVCAAGTYAIGFGLDAIRQRDTEVALCGGADVVSRSAITGFQRLRALAPDACRPFDRDRKGVVFGDGAAVLVLESLEHAERRGAVPRAEITGFHLNCDAQHATKPNQERVTRCLAGALSDASLSPEDVDLIFAHGTGTRANDRMEVAAVREVFGPEPPPATAVKSMIGHTMGAAGAHSCIAAILGMRHDFIPPTVNFRTPDPACPIDCVPNLPREAALDAVLVNSLGFGGNNAAIVLQRYAGDR